MVTRFPVVLVVYILYNCRNRGHNLPIAFSYAYPTLCSPQTHMHAIWRILHTSIPLCSICNLLFAFIANISTYLPCWSCVSAHNRLLYLYSRVHSVLLAFWTRNRSCISFLAHFCWLWQIIAWQTQYYHICTYVIFISCYNLRIMSTTLVVLLALHFANCLSWAFIVYHIFF